VREVARTGKPDVAQIPQLLAAVIAAGGTERALMEARQITDRALMYLNIFERSSATRALGEICDFVLTRQA
jgi:geranylgeranyl pyrophosphate synthase